MSIRLILSTVMYNEIIKGPHVDLQMNDALECDFDKIVIFDDGSTDGTWELLNDYRNKYKHIHIFRNDKNSLRSENSQNRWLTLAQECAKFKPNWVCIRAADQTYSFELRKNIRNRIKQLSRRGADQISIPVRHLWRSSYWFRTDRDWAGGLNMGFTVCIWKFRENFNLTSRVMDHQGAHIPNAVGPILSINNGVNLVDGYEKYVMLHHAFTTHDKMKARFIDTMERANTGRALFMPPPKNMPPVVDWIKFNGYKVFCEFDIELEKVPSVWLGYEVSDEPKPAPKSLYNTIRKYNIERAKEYRRLFSEYIYNKFDLLTQDSKTTRSFGLPKVRIIQNVIDKNFIKFCDKCKSDGGNKVVMEQIVNSDTSHQCNVIQFKCPACLNLLSVVKEEYKTRLRVPYKICSKCFVKYKNNIFLKPIVSVNNTFKYLCLECGSKVVTNKNREKYCPSCIAGREKLMVCMEVSNYSEGKDYFICPKCGFSKLIKNYKRKTM